MVSTEWLLGVLRSLLSPAGGPLLSGRWADGFVFLFKGTVVCLLWWPGVVPCSEKAKGSGLVGWVGLHLSDPVPHAAFHCSCLELYSTLFLPVSFLPALCFRLSSANCVSKHPRPETFPSAAQPGPRLSWGGHLLRVRMRCPVHRLLSPHGVDLRGEGLLQGKHCARP